MDYLEYLIDGVVRELKKRQCPSYLEYSLEPVSGYEEHILLWGHTYEEAVWKCASALQELLLKRDPPLHRWEGCVWSMEYESWNDRTAEVTIRVRE